MKGESWGFPGGSVVKNPHANAGDTGGEGSTPGLARSLEEEEMTIHLTILENSMERGAW